MSTAAETLVAFLAQQGVTRAFCVPGESYVAVLDALHAHPSIDLVTCRHESGAGFMAMADARLTGVPGVALVSRGPGACNASIAVHTAMQDSVPLLLIVGQVEARDLRARAFQEIDYTRMFDGVAKFTAEATNADQVPELISRAWAAMLTGIPGPAVLALPEDILAEACTRTPLAPVLSSDAAPSPQAADQLAELLRTAERPIVIAGGDLDRPGGREELLAFAERWQLPVAVSFRRQDLFPNAYKLYAGDMGLSNPKPQREAFARADLILALGTRLGDITTQGYSFPEPGQRLVHGTPSSAPCTAPMPPGRRAPPMTAWSSPTSSPPSARICPRTPSSRWMPAPSARRSTARSPGNWASACSPPSPAPWATACLPPSPPPCATRTGP
jgi:acetolactate synthase-1/2/3 large subunit